MGETKVLAEADPGESPISSMQVMPYRKQDQAHLKVSRIRNILKPRMLSLYISMLSSQIVWFIPV
jgi:hypothetical protein